MWLEITKKLIIVIDMKAEWNPIKNQIIEITETWLGIKVKKYDRRR